MKKIKLFLTDVDGTLTDGGMYYGSSGEEYKKFNSKDGEGISSLLRAGIPVGFITGEVSNITDYRAKKLKVPYVFKGCSRKDKLKHATKLCKKLGISMSEVAYIGDDFNDSLIMQKVGIAACPADAHEDIITLEDDSGNCCVTVMNKNGGEAVVREFIDFLKEVGYVR
jgi:YrbI family 3-deoxy-D-manno-octulosonate 8-phosphate phosphatase